MGLVLRIWQNFEFTLAIIYAVGQIYTGVPKWSNILKTVNPSGHTDDETNGLARCSSDPPFRLSHIRILNESTIPKNDKHCLFNPGQSDMIHWAVAWHSW